MLEGKLVNLRAPEMGDLERNFRWMNDPDVTQHLNMRYPISMAAEEAWMRERKSQTRTHTRTHTNSHTHTRTHTHTNKHTIFSF